MSIRDGVTKFNVILDELPKRAFVRMTELTEISVKDGSDITGTQGIPVATGNAQQSVIGEFLPGEELRWQITATGKNAEGEPVGYVEHIEANLRGVTFANGGPHFFSKTVAGLDQLWDRAKQDVGA